jgi:hypothetical protein
LKASQKYSQDEASVPIVKGTWPDRVARYKDVFGTVPANLEAAIPELEKLRKFRNGVGHAFGRDIGTVVPLVDLKPASSQRLSEDRLKRWLGVSESVAKAVDRHLVGSHVGSYELVRLYHDWPKRLSMFAADQPRALKKEIGAVSGSEIPSVLYFRGMMTYYREAPTS